MSAIEIKKVASRRDLKQFVEFHYDLYEGNAYDVPNLYTDEVNTLRKDKNPAFEFCQAEYFMAFRDGKMVGRVAAIINHRANERWKTQSVRFDWIDYLARMAVERDDHRPHSFCMGSGDDVADEVFVSTVNAVEKTDGSHGGLAFGCRHFGGGGEAYGFHRCFYGCWLSEERHIRLMTSTQRSPVASCRVCMPTAAAPRQFSSRSSMKIVSAASS